MSESWVPRCSLEEADKILTAPGSLLEVETRVVGDRLLRVFKNLWPSARALWLHATKEHADKIYVVYENERITFQEMLQRSMHCAAVFREIYGVRKGDRVVICSRNAPAYYVAFWACHLLGAVTALVNAWLPLEPLQHCIAVTKCKLILVDPERANVIEPIIDRLKDMVGASGCIVMEEHEGKGVWTGMENFGTIFSRSLANPESGLDDPQITPEDEATIVFTSGTTGLPKGVLSSQRAFLTVIFTNAFISGRDAVRRGESFPPPPVVGPQKGALLSTPLFHVTGTAITLNATVFGYKLVLLRKWNGSEAARLCREENVRSLGGIPFMLTDLEHELAGFPMENITLGGAPVAGSLVVRSKGSFPSAVMANAYGLTETNSTAIGLAGEDYMARPESSGLPLPVTDLIIMKQDIEAVPGEVGEVWIRGPGVMKRYLGDQAATDKALTQDGWLMTGDLGYRDADGFLFIKGRIKDIIIRGGENVDCVSVESALHTDPGVLEAAAVGIPDKRLGELVAAVVTVKPSWRGKVKEEKLLSVVRRLLPKFAVPIMVMVQDGEFVHTPSGKIVKSTLRIVAQKEWERRTRNSDSVKHKL
ncbi:long-chain-fatty-acid-CoA ligase [Guyanagaster necrorhizus]|uniref:Long-chain-fatty-acid-CoA ligase n=1 Tax=Guyanagaster necrorhizus TaxID=856835 RepID=A0A9P7VJT5_9AGAR|nr:long-chain-fatty-acid-CoA ligase [Guyanagaster necrorhizus MCA 3950]KAG7442441.1 long-chain-fatty-acid-CoA ligase [Guyanagaster necrorhizus MCA 3950]